MGFFRRKGKDAAERGAPRDTGGKGSPGSSCTYVRFMELTGLVDVTPISEEVRRGNIVIADVMPMARPGSDLRVQLKRAVDQLRAVCYGVDGDIGQLGNRYLILTPNNVKIFREEREEAQGQGEQGPPPS